MNIPQEPYPSQAGFLKQDSQATEPGKLPAGRLRQLLTLLGGVARRSDMASLIESIAFLQTLADNSTDAIYLKDREGRYLMVNATFAYWTRRTADDILGRTDRELFHQRVAEQLSHSDQQVISSGQALSEETNLAGDDAERAFLTTKVPFRDAQQQVIGVLGVARDVTQRKAMEEELRESQQFSEQIINYAREGVVVLDEQLRFALWNPFMEEFIGIPKAKVIGRLPLEVFPTAGEARLLQYLERALQGETINRVDLHLDSARGPRTAWASCSFSPHRDVHGDIVGVICTASDIGERKKAEAALRRSQQFNQQVINNSSYGIVVYDREWRYMVWNPAMEEMSGLQAEDVLGRRVTEILSHVQEQGLTQMLQQALQGDVVESVDFRLSPHKSIWVRAHYGPLRDADEQVIGVIGMVTNVTARRHAEDALRDSKQFNEQIINSSLEGIAVCDRDLRVLVWNPLMAELSGIQRVQTEGKTAQELFPHLRGTVAEEQWQSALQGEVVAGKDFQFPNNPTRWASAVYGPLRNQHGKIVGIIITVRDITARRRAEDALRESKQFNDQIIHSVKEGIVVHDRELRYVEWNPFMQELRGLKREQVVGKHPYEIFPELVQTEFLALIGRVLGGETTTSRDFEQMRQSGETAWLTIRYEPLRTPGGEVTGVLGVVNDITERKQAEEALRASQQFSQQIIENAREGFIVYDRELKIKVWNRFMEEVTGLTQTQVEDKHPFEIFPYFRTTGHLSLISAALSGDAVTGQDFQLTAPATGKKYWLSARYGPHKGIQGETVGVIVTLRDVTARRFAEQAVRESEERYRDILEAIQDGYYEFDLKGDLVLFNDSLCRIYGCDKSEMFGQAHRRWLTRETYKRVLHVFGRVLESDQPSPSFDYEVNRKDGEKRILETYVSLIRNDRGEPTGYRGLVRDVTERRTAELRLANQARYAALRADVTATVADDIPLLEMLQRCTEAVVRHLGAVWASIWLLNDDEAMLDAKVSSGEYAPPEPYLQVRLGETKIGRIAATRTPFLSNDLQTDPQLSEQDWAHRTGLIAFAGCPLVTNNLTQGVLAFWAKEPLHEDTLDSLHTASALIAQGIERRQIEQSLHSSENRFRALIEHSNDGVILMDAQGCATYVSPSQQHILGFAPAMLEGHSLKPLIHPDSLKVIRRAIVALQEGQSTRLEYRARNAEGDYRWLEGTITNLLQEPSVQAYVVNFHDITAAKQAEASRVQAEASLRTSEEQMRSIWTHVLDAMLLLNDDGYYTDANPAACQLFGLSKDDLVGQHFTMFAGPEHRITALQAWQKLCQEGRDEGYFQMPLPGRGTRWIEYLSITNVMQGRHLIVYRDITERRDAEAAVRASEARFRALIESSWDGLTMQDRDGRTVYISPSFTRILGYSAEEVMQTDQVSRMHPDDIAMVMQVRAEALAHPGQQFTVQHRIRHRDGAWRVLESAATNLLDDPNVRAIVINFRDITERRQAEEEIRQREEKFRAIWDSAMDAMLIVNDEMEYVDANPAACELYGVKREDIIHRTMADFVPPEKRDMAQRSLQKLIASGERKGEFQMLQPDHTIREIEYSARANFMPGLHLSVMRDVTERARAEEQLRASEERYRSVVTALDEGIVMIGSEGELLTCNQSATRVLGMSREELLTHGMIDKAWRSIHEDGRPFSIEDSPAFHTLRTGEPCRGVVWGLLRNDDAPTWISVNSHPIFQGDAAKPYAVVLSMNDITERKRAEAAKIESETRFAAIFNASPLPICLNEMDTGKTINVNPAWSEKFGYSASEALGRTGLELGIWEHPAERQDYLDRLRRDGTVRNFEMLAHTKPGELCLFLNSAETLEWNGKRYYLSINQDITERKRAEERFVKAFDANPNPMVILSVKQQSIVQANDALQKFLGHTPAEFAEIKAFGDGHWVNDEQRQQFINQLESRGCVRDLEAAIFTRDRQVRTVLVSAEQIELDGQPHVLATINDITERKRAEEALRVSEERFSKAFNACPDPMSITTITEGHYVMVNAAWLRVHGLQAEDVIGRTSTELELWVDPEERRRLYEQIVLKGSIRDFETCIRNASGGIDNVLISSEMVMLGGEWYVLSVRRNITERKRAEEALRSSELRFASTFNGCPEPMALNRLDDRRYVAMNQAALRSLGLSLKDVVGHTPEEINLWVHENQQKEFTERLTSLGEVRDFESNFYLKGGRIGDFLVSAEILQLDGVPHVLTVSRDITERKRAETALRVTEERLARTFDACPEPMSLNRVQDGCMVAINKAALASFDWTREEIIGKSYKDISFWSDAKQLRQFRKLLKAQGVVKDFEVETSVKGGASTCFLISAEVLQIDDVAHVLCVGRDITERKRAEAALRLSEERFSKAFKASPHPIAITAFSTEKFLMVNEAWSKVHGYSSEEALAQNSTDLDLWVEAEQRDAYIRQALETGSVRNFECELRDKDGVSHYLLLSGEKIQLGDESYLLSIALDMTERRQAEAALRVSEERFEQAFRLSPHPMLINGMDGRIVHVNRALIQASGYCFEELIGKTALELGLWADAAQRDLILAELKQTGSVRNREVNLLTREGRQLQALYSSEKVEFNGKPHVLSSLVDITELKRIETELRASQERFSTAFHASPQAMVICNALSNEVVSVNASMLKLIGYTEAEVLGRTCEALAIWTKPDVQPAIQQRLQAEGRIRAWQLELRSQAGLGGGRRFTEVSVDTIQLNDAPHLLFIFNDITEREQAEAARRASEERFAKAFTASPQAMLIAQAASNQIVSTNRSLCLLLGYEENQVLGNTIEGLNLWVKQHQHETFKQLLKHNGHLRDWTTELRRQDGAERTVQISVEPVQLNGTPHLLYLLVDITERKQSEEALRASEERFSTAFQANPQPMGIFRATDQKFVFVNQAFMLYLERSENEIIGRTVSEVGWWTDDKTRDEFFKRLSAGRKVQDYEAKLQLNAGEMRTHLLSAEYIRLDHQPHVLVVALDITERHRAEAELRASEERFSKAFEASPQPMALAAWPGGELVSINRKLSEVTGYQREDVLGKRLIDLSAWLTLADRNRFLEAANKGQLRDWEVRLRVKSGEILMMQLSTESVVLEDKPHLLVTATDVTARKRAEAIIAGQVRTLELMASGARLPAVLDTIARFVDEQQFDAHTAVSLLDPERMQLSECYGPSLSPAFRQAILDAALTDESGVNGTAVMTQRVAIFNDLPSSPPTEFVSKSLANPQMRSAWALPIFDTQRKVLGTISLYYDQLHIPTNEELKLGEIAAQLAGLALERNEAEQALRESEGRYRQLFERNLAGVYRATEEGNFLECNDAYAAIFGLSNAEELMRYQAEAFYFDLADRERYLQLLREQSSVTNYEMRLRRIDGNEVWVLCNVTLTPRDGETGTLEGVMLDITKRKQAEAKLSEQREQLHALTAKVSAVREEERTVISREIHDSLGQLLTGLKLDISWLGKRINQQVEGETRDLLVKKTDSIAELLDLTIGTVRELATQLRPGVLDTLGLTAAIEWQVQDFKTRSSIECELWLCPEPKNLPQEKSTVVFRILQEILTNIIRHAEASHVVIHLMPNAEALLLTVIDNGRGITVAELHNPKSLGLLGMRERANSIGGEVKLDGAAGRGTTVSVRIPLGPVDASLAMNTSGMMNPR